MLKSRVAILRGGPSYEYEASLRSGHRVKSYVPDHYDATDIYIDKKGNWHHNGVKKTPEKILRHFDVIFNAMHGEYGEDGKVQKILESHNSAYSGSNSFSSSLAMNKIKTKELLALHGIKTPKFTYVKKDEYSYGDLSDVFASIPRPMIVKPASSGSSMGVHVVATFDELVSAVNNVFKVGDVVLVEEFIRGKEVSCGVLDHSNGTDVYTFYPVEIQHNCKNGVWTTDSRNDGSSYQMTCPSTLDVGIKNQIQETTHRAHSLLGLRHYSCSDFLVTDKGDVYFLETDSHPRLDESSVYSTSLEAAGLTMSTFVDHLLTLALKRK